MDKPPLYAQFDGDEIDGVRYGLGDEIKRDKHELGTLTVVEAMGRIGSSKPATTIVIPADDGKPVEDMNRTELEQAAMSIFSKQLPAMSDDDLRDGIQRRRDAEEGSGNAAPRDDGGSSDYDALKDKPLSQLRTAELEVVAKAEGVDLGEAKTNADKAAAIEAKRHADATT